MIASQIPDDPHWAEVILAAKMKNLLFDLDWRAVGVSLWDRWPTHQAGLPMFAIGLTPSIETAAADAEVPTCLRNLTSLISMLKNSKLTRNLALILAHEHLLRPIIGSLMEMSREYRHIYKHRIQRKFVVGESQRPLLHL